MSKVEKLKKLKSKVEWLNAAEATEYFCLETRKALYQRVSRGEIPCFKLGRSLRFKRSDLDLLMESHPVQPHDELLKAYL